MKTRRKGKGKTGNIGREKKEGRKKIPPNIFLVKVFYLGKSVTHLRIM